jgi:hypothetical protein
MDNYHHLGYGNQIFCIITIYHEIGDIILYDGHLVVYRHSLDLIFYLVGSPAENEIMLQAALGAFFDAINLLLRGGVEKRAVLENLDLVLLCLDETIDDGYVLSLWRSHFQCFILRSLYGLFH